MGESGDAPDCGNYYNPPIAEANVNNISSDYHQQWLQRFYEERAKRNLDDGDWDFPFGD